MDVKSLITRSSSDFVESPFSFLKGLFNENSGSLGGNVKQDALEAVKLDPAVLEAQVTVHSKDKAIDAAHWNTRPEVVIENKIGGGSSILPKKEDHFQQRIISLISTSAVGLFNPYDKDSIIPAVQDQVAMVVAHTEDFPAAEIEYIERVPTPPARVPTPSQSPNGFKDMVLQHEAALLSLTPHQLELLMQYADVLRKQRMITQRYLECAFCKNNGKPSFWYKSHALRDARGRVRCPVLRGFRCPRCGATGDQAHTIKYCPDLITDSQSSCSGKSSL